MTWTYGGDPSGSDRDKVRFSIGDTNTADQQMTDEEIAYLITTHGVGLAIVKAAYALAGKYARMSDKAVGDLSIKYSQRARAYLDLAKELDKDWDEAQNLSGLAIPLAEAGGIGEGRFFRATTHDFWGSQNFDDRAVE